MPEVLNKYALMTKGGKIKMKLGENQVYIGRPSKWGNPFVIGPDGTRQEVVAKFRDYLLQRPELIEAVKRELRGKDLVCFCTPLSCHGDVLLEIANETTSRSS